MFRHHQDLVEQNIRIAFGALILLFLPVLLVTLLAPPPRGAFAFDRRLVFDTSDDGTATLVSIGTPPKPSRFALSGTECGITVWGRPATDSYSWIAAKAVDEPHGHLFATLPGASGFGEDFVAVGGARMFLPMRYVASAESTSDDVQGVIGVCPHAIGAWNLTDATYFARCGRLIVGSHTPRDCMFEECGESDADWAAHAGGTGAPWIVKGPLRFDVFHSGRRGGGGNEDDLAMADCDQLATLTTDAGAHIFPCVPCAYGMNAVVLVLVVVAVLSTTWSSMITSPGTRPRIVRIVSAATSLAAICFFVAMRFGSDAGCLIAREAGTSARVVVNPIFFVGVVVLAMANLVTLALHRRRKGAAVSLLSGARLLTELPLLMAFWYAAYALPNFFARVLIVGGAATVITILTSTIALGSALRHRRWDAWIGYCAAGGALNAAVMGLTGLPLAAMFFGYAGPMRLAAATIFFVVTAFPALLLATGRVLDVYAYENRSR